VVDWVLHAVNQARHVRPIFYTDAELPLLPEEDAPGIGAFRNRLNKILVQRERQSLPHEQIIGMLDETGKVFHILILKTKVTLPYTSVFVQLDCGYWNAQAERNLRRKAAKQINRRTR
jgi:hypothetical protein